jgi:TM2 domain-containing membrane protein YozV
MSDPRPYPGADGPSPYAGGVQPYAPHPGPPPYGSEYPPPHGYAYPPASGAPGYAYAYDPVTGAPWSDKNRTTAGLLQLLLSLVGVCGVGRLYAGQTAVGLVQLLGFFVGCALMVVLIGFLIAPAVWIWAVVDGIVLLSSGGRDGFGRPLR